jgi:hypothetical protein
MHAPIPAPATEALAAYPGGEWPLSSHVSLLALPFVVPCARRHARCKLAQWHVSGGIVGGNAETIQLVVSELVTNAICAYPGKTQLVPSVQLWLSAGHGSVLVQVWDANDAMPVLQDPGLDALGGRGLMLVDALATDWGWYHCAALPGKVTWALVAAYRG